MTVALELLTVVGLTWLGLWALWPAIRNPDRSRELHHLPWAMFGGGVAAIGTLLMRDIW